MLAEHEESPYDNAVTQANFKLFETGLGKGRNFDNLVQLKVELVDYVYWLNHLCMHSALGYRVTGEYRL